MSTVIGPRLPTLHRDATPRLRRRPPHGLTGLTGSHRPPPGCCTGPPTRTCSSHWTGGFCLPRRGGGRAAGPGPAGLPGPGAGDPLVALRRAPSPSPWRICWDWPPRIPPSSTRTRPGGEHGRGHWPPRRPGQPAAILPMLGRAPWLPRSVLAHHPPLPGVRRPPRLDGRAVGSPVWCSTRGRCPQAGRSSSPYDREDGFRPADSACSR